MPSKTTIVVAGVCGTLFIGSCIYFVRKRGNNLRFKRVEQVKALLMKEKAKRNASMLSERKDCVSVQKFFIQKAQLGEELVKNGDIENGVEHLSAALVVCNEPNHLIEAWEQQFPAQVFDLLIKRLPTVSQRQFIEACEYNCCQTTT